MAKRDAPPADLDAVTAHLDRGWDLLKDNDLGGAEISAKKALKLDPDSPEPATLLGAVAAAGGDLEAALDAYRQALEVDPEYVPALLYAAEAHLEPDTDEEDAEEALRLCDQALEGAEEEDDVVDAILLKAEALVRIGDRDEEARATLAELPPVALPEGSYHLRAATTYLDLSMVDEAEAQFRRALELDEDDADAWHGLGLCAEERDDARGMVKAWLKVREIDLEEPPPPWAVSQEEFEAIAEAALAELPERIRGLLENVPILAADYPAVEIVTEGADPRMMGFFSGVPYPEKSNIAGAVPHLDCVSLYKRNIERASRTREEVAREVRTTLLHETGHFFGLSEEELEEMGLG